MLEQIDPSHPLQKQSRLLFPKLIICIWGIEKLKATGAYCKRVARNRLCLCFAKDSIKDSAPKTNKKKDCKNAS